MAETAGIDRAASGGTGWVDVCEEDALRLGEGMTWVGWEMTLEANRQSMAKSSRRADDDRVAISKGPANDSGPNEPPKRRRTSTGEISVAQQRMLESAQSKRFGADGTAKNPPRMSPRKQPGHAAEDAHPKSSVSRSTAVGQQPSSSELDWTADFDVATEESLAELM